MCALAATASSVVIEVSMFWVRCLEKQLSSLTERFPHKEKFELGPHGMNLRQLGYFIAIAQHSSFLKASKTLNISQPSVSAQIKLLEEELEVQLFERRSNGTVLTPEGREFLIHARTILETIAVARNSMRAHQTAEVGQVSVGIPGSLASTLTVPVVEASQKELPNVQLRVASGLSGHIRQWILGGSLDFGLVYTRSPLVGLDLEPLLSEELYVAARERSALKKQLTIDGEIPLRNLAGLPLVLPGREHGLRTAVEEGAAQLGVALHVRTELDAPEQLKEMVRRTGCFTILSLAALQNDHPGDRLFTARITSPSIERVVCLANASGRPLSRAARRIEQILKSIIREELRKGWWKSAVDKGLLSPYTEC